METNIIPMSAGARQPSECSVTSATIARCEERLRPIGQKAGHAELMACLTLVAPPSWSPADRDEWAKVAAHTLSGIPADLLKLGCQRARISCEFPSQIVKTVMEVTEAEWNRRKKALREEREWAADTARLPAPELCDPQEAADIVAELTAKLSA